MYGLRTLLIHIILRGGLLDSSNAKFFPLVLSSSTLIHKLVLEVKKEPVGSCWKGVKEVETREFLDYYIVNYIVNYYTGLDMSP